MGKTLSARHYAGWDAVQAYWDSPEAPAALLEEVSGGTTAFYTARVVCSPAQLLRDVQKARHLRHDAAVRRVERRENARMQRLLRYAQDLRDPRKNPDGYRSAKAERAEAALLRQRDRGFRASRGVADPTALLVIDEADRLREAALEQVRDIFDAGGIGVILIGMPGLEKRLARYPQLYSRIGFVHEFRTLAESAVRQLLAQGWAPPGVRLPPPRMNEETVAAIIRITRGNFRLLTRLLTQAERIVEVNSLGEVTRAVVEAARESLVIGEA